MNSARYFQNLVKPQWVYRLTAFVTDQDSRRPITTRWPESFLCTKTYYGTAADLQNQRPSTLLILPNADGEQLTRSYSEDEIGGMRERLRSIRSNLRTARVEAQRGGKRVEQRQLVALRNQASRIDGILATLDEDGVPKTYGMGVQDFKEAVHASVLVRGDVEKPAQKVERGFLQVLDTVGKANIKPGRSGRRELALPVRCPT